MTSSRNIALGVFWASMAILIWSGSLVLLRFGVTTGLTAHDLTALRFGVAATLLLPVVIRNGTGTDALGLNSMLLMIASFGAPYVLLLSLALKTVPATAAGALNPGVMAMASAVMARMIHGETLATARLFGIGLAAIGISGFVFAGDGFASGHVMLLLTGIMWAGYAAIVRSKSVPALNATAIVAVGSAALYLPVYAVALPKQIMEAPLPDVLLQAGFQGILVSTVAVYAFTRSVELLPVAGTSLPALIPVVTLGLEILVLRETPHLGEVVGASLVTLGLAFVLMGRWPVVPILSVFRR